MRLGAALPCYFRGEGLSLGVHGPFSRAIRPPVRRPARRQSPGPLSSQGSLAPMPRVTGSPSAPPKSTGQ